MESQRKQLAVAIDTSTDIAGLALVQDGKVLAELTWRAGQNHTVELLPNLCYLLSETGLSVQSAGCIVVAIGPGSYNGLRAGISAAKGLALGLGIPIVGISTLEAAAYQHAGTGLPVCAILNAGRGEIAAAIYQMKREWQQLVAEHTTTVEGLISRITIRTVFCGEPGPSIAAQLKKELKRKAILPSPAACVRRAGFLAELGLKRFSAGDYDDAATLQPLYFRGPSITKAKHR